MVIFCLVENGHSPSSTFSCWKCFDTEQKLHCYKKVCIKASGMNSSFHHNKATNTSTEPDLKKLDNITVIRQHTLHPTAP